MDTANQSLTAIRSPIKINNLKDFIFRRTKFSLSI